MHFNWKLKKIWNFFHPPTSNITWKLILIDDTATWNAHQNHVEKILFLSIISNHSNLFSSHIPIIFCGSYQSQLCTSSLFRMRDEQNEYCRSIKKNLIAMRRAFKYSTLLGQQQFSINEARTCCIKDRSNTKKTVKNVASDTSSGFGFCWIFIFKSVNFSTSITQFSMNEIFSYCQSFFRWAQYSEKFIILS